MSRINCNLLNFNCPAAGFRPYPKSTFWELPRTGEDPRRHKALSRDLRTGLVILGLTSEDETQRFSLDDVVPVVREVRLRQVGDPGASFISQRGLFRHPERGTITEEDSVRIILLDIASEGPDLFREHVLELAEILVDRFEQRSAIVEIQLRGMTEEIVSVGPAPEEVRR